MPINKVSSYNNFNPSFTHNTSNNDNSKEKKGVRAKVAASAMFGVASAYAIIAKRQGFSLNPKKIYNTPFQDWAIFKIFNKNRPDRKLITLKEWQILGLASGSVAGGLAGGALFDEKKNLKAKGREAINQILGNVLVPVIFVGQVSRLYEKYQNQILSKVPQIKESLKNPKLVKYTNKAMKCVPSALLTIIGLGAGIVVGNKVSNFINEQIFHKKVDRKIKSSDFAPHVDDLSMAVTLMADKNAFTTAITNTIPLFLCVPGIETGIAKED